MSRTKERSGGSTLPLPLQFLAAWLAVWLGRALQDQVDYLKAEVDSHFKRHIALAETHPHANVR